MSVCRKISGVCLAILLAGGMVVAADFEWSWRNQEVIGRNDPSVGNTSKLKEAERIALIDLIVARLQKPMSERGYDDDRIREIASTTRVRFVEVGSDKPLVFASSLGMEGGCDALGNCPLWIFRPGPDGYVAVCEAQAASYTLQPSSSNGLTDIVTMRHVSAAESSLTLHRYGEGRYADAGCYTAMWAAARDGEVLDPTLTPCQAKYATPAGVAAPEIKPDEPKPADAVPAETEPVKPEPEDGKPNGAR